MLSTNMYVYVNIYKMVYNVKARLLLKNVLFEVHTVGFHGL